MSKKSKPSKGPSHSDEILSKAIRVMLPDRETFSIIVETLTRVGLPSSHGLRLMQICFLLHKRGQYFIMHFKELQALDGFPVKMTAKDIQQRDAIIRYLEDWNLVNVCNPEKLSEDDAYEDIRVIKHDDKTNWTLIPQYQIGRPERTAVA